MIPDTRTRRANDAAVVAAQQLEHAYMRLGKAHFLGEPIDTAWRECAAAMEKWHRLG